MEVQMKGIKKAFGKNRVLEGVDVTVKAGQVHALMGENGAGKSTLMNILTGLYKRDAGQILIDGEETYYENPLDAEKHGISFIHQEMNNFAEMTVLDNMFLNREIKGPLGILKQAEMRKIAKENLAKLGTDIDLDVPVGSLSVGRQQMIEIAKSLMSDAKVLIMDEPTAALTEKEIEKLFDVIRSLKERGVGIIYISHRMEEIMKICDHITVMRDGISVNSYPTGETNMAQIVRDMVGREMRDFYPERSTQPGDIALKVTDIERKGVFDHINFEVHAGEILAFSGLMGAGRTEIMRAIFGIDKLDSGQIQMNGTTISNKTPGEAIKNNIGFLTENRKDEGLILNDSIADNIALPSIGGFVKHGLVDDKAVADFVALLMKRLHVKATGPSESAGSLSGGNQQKVVLAKWIGSGTQVLILDEPTRGVDVGARREIYDLMNKLTNRGVAIIMVSSDLDEVLGMSDRIAVVYEGHITGIIPTKTATQESVMTLATGGQVNE